MTAPFEATAEPATAYDSTGVTGLRRPHNIVEEFGPGMVMCVAAQSIGPAIAAIKALGGA